MMAIPRVRSIVARAQAQRYSFPTPLDLASMYSVVPPEPDLILPGLRPGTVGSIVSPGGAGKSMLAMELAHYIAAGVDVMQIREPGAPIKTGRVIYLSGEDGADVLHERIFAFGAMLSPVDREVAAENLSILDMTHEAPDLLSPTFFSALDDLITDARVVFIDTLRTFHTGDEQDNNEMSSLTVKLRALARAKQCSIIFIHHTNKAAAMNGQGDLQQASRGASALTDNIRWQAFVASMTKEEAEVFGVLPDERWQFVRFGLSKMNYGRKPDDIWLKRVDGGALKRCAGVAGHFGSDIIIGKDPLAMPRPVIPLNGGAAKRGRDRVL